jgi:hypothetical protein
MKFSRGITFATSLPLRPGLGSSDTHSRPAQGPTSRETSSLGIHVLTYHPPPGASAKRNPRAAHPAENTSSASPPTCSGTRRTSSPLSPSLTTTWCKGARRLTESPVASPLCCCPTNLIATSRSFSHVTLRGQAEPLPSESFLGWLDPLQATVRDCPLPLSRTCHFL